MQPTKVEQDSIDYICNRLRHSGVERFCSPLLIYQLAEQHQSTGSSAMIDLIVLIQEHRETDFVSWPRGPKRPNQFKKPPLIGLWKAHTTPHGLGEIAQNLHNEVDKEWFKKKLRKLFQDHRGGVFNKQLTGRIIHLAVIQGIANRGMRSNLTSGHWLIFANTPHGAYYLCRAHHDEDDALILDRARKATKLFPNSACPIELL